MTPVTSRKRISSWLLSSVAVIMALLLLLPYLVDSDTLKTRLQAAIEQQTGGKVEFKQAELSFLPRLSITLHQIKLDIPDKVQGTVGTIQVYPELLALLVGQVRLARLVLESPEVVLNLAAAQTTKEESPANLTFLTLQKSLAKGLVPMAKFAPGLRLVINNGTLTLNQDKQALSLFKNLALKLDLDTTESRPLQAKLQGSVSELMLHRNGRKVPMEKLTLSGVLRVDEKMIALSIENLALAEPRLQLKGGLKSGLAVHAFEIDLQATGLDVGAIRKAALALAGDISPTKEIFDYLRDGTVSQISFYSQGKTASALGDLKNIIIKGHLQAGAVSIPEIKLDLTEVNGDVVITDGVLEGTGVSTRLEGSSGHDGTLKVGLVEGNDLFQMDLMLKADLAQAQHILKLIVENPEFTQQVENITNLKGTGTGKLILGDSLTDINARVEIAEMNLTADYQGLPFPVGISKGQLLFAENQVELKDLNGTFGSSDFSGLACNISLKDVLSLDINSGKFDLVLDELYPWVASLDAVKESLKDIKQISGRLELVTLSLKGAVDASENWQFSATGAINGLSIEMVQSTAGKGLAKDDSSKEIVSVGEGPSLTFDVEYLADQLQVKQLTVKDQHSDAKVAFVHNRDELSLDFTGTLHHETLESLFTNQRFGKGQMKGDFGVKVPSTRQVLPVAKGHLEAKGLSLPLPSGENLEIEKIIMVAEGTQIKADASTVSWNGITWDPFNVTIGFEQDKIDIRATEAKLCGINSSGLLTIIGDDLSLDVILEGKGLDVATSYSCLTEGKVKMTGTLDFSAKISAQGEAGELVGKMQGPIKMNITKGSINQSKLLARTLEVLNVTEIVKGKLPDLGSTSFIYSTITMQGFFYGKKLIIENVQMDGDTLDILGQGEIDFEQETIDVELMAAPFKTIDTVVKFIPGINYLLAGSLVAIPVSVKGAIDDPKILVMSPSSVGSGLLKLGERVIKSPVRLIETLTP